MEFSEDQTAIIKRIVYDQRNDTLVGFCGVECSEHECQQNFTICVGDGEDGYNNILKAFEKHRIYHPYQDKIKN